MSTSTFPLAHCEGTRAAASHGIFPSRKKSAFSECPRRMLNGRRWTSSQRSQEPTPPPGRAQEGNPSASQSRRAMELALAHPLFSLFCSVVWPCCPKLRLLNATACAYCSRKGCLCILPTLTPTFVTVGGINPAPLL